VILGCVDVDYRADGSAVAACLVFGAWEDAASTAEHVARIPVVEPYEPGAFYRRELPCVLAVLEQTSTSFDVLIVDAYVTLDATGTPGLGAHLHAALGGTPAVVGVAKTRFAKATTALPVTRGTSAQPLWITAIGVDPEEAADRIRAMHGPHRVPTLLRRVDQLARDA
jgi:deoxyribonuclease V